MALLIARVLVRILVKDVEAAVDEVRGLLVAQRRVGVEVEAALVCAPWSRVTLSWERCW